MQKIPKQAYKQKEKRNNLKKAQATLELNNVAPKLSQSLVKELYKYKLKEECGLRVEAKYVTKSVEFPSSEVQELGNYFEYKATGQLPRDGHTPEPILLKTGKPSIDYIRMDAQVENFKRVMKRLNFSVEQTGFTFTNPKYSGIADIIAHDDNIKSKDVMKKRIIIDLKTSGLLNDKWNAWGWADESIEEKDELLIQAIHYKLLAKYEWGIEDIPFYFMIFSNKNDWEYKIFKVNVDEATLQQHYNNLLNIKKFLDDTMRNGWIPYPKYAVCRECPLSISLCNHATDIPKVQEVFI
jgi:hypothetical protein